MFNNNKYNISERTLRMSIRSGCSRTLGRTESSGLWIGSATCHILTQIKH